MLANMALYTTMCRSITWLAQVTELTRAAGLPAVADSIPFVTKPGPNMNGWYCREASSSHSSPRQTCNPRRPGMGSAAARAERTAERTDVHGDRTAVNRPVSGAGAAAGVPRLPCVSAAEVMQAHRLRILLYLA